MSALKHAHKLRSLVPQAARERLYDWHPGRDRRWRRHPGIQRVAEAGHAVITLDDGPDADATPAVLDALDAAGARATFFILAVQLRAHAEIAAEVLRRGHEVGLHGYDHHRHDRISGRQSHEDLKRGFGAIEDAIGVRCRWFRPPYGKMSDGAAAACRELGMTPVYWSAWGLDWEDVEAGRIAQVAGEQLEDGGILLLHDSARHARRPSAVPTAQAIPLIVGRMRERGIAPITLGEAIAA